MEANREVPEGYEVPIHRALVQPLYWMGVTRNNFIGENVLAVLGGFILKTIKVILINVASQ